MALVLPSDSFKIGLLIAAATLLGSCLSAPADPWWYHPCNSEIKRHSRSTHTGLTLIHNQMRILLNQLRISKQKINALYKKQATKTKTPAGNLRWLKIKKWQRDIRRAPPNDLRPFYTASQYFAATLDELRNKNIETSAEDFNQQERDAIYQNITSHLRLLLCEVQDNIRNNNLPVPAGKTTKAMKIDKKFLAMLSLDLTAGHIWDINFFKKATSFFKQNKFNKKTKKVRKNNSEVKSKKRT